MQALEVLVMMMGWKSFHPLEEVDMKSFTVLREGVT